MEEKKVCLIDIFHVSKKKRGILKESLLASAVALLLSDNFLSFDDVFIFLVMRGRKKKKLIKKEVRKS